ncbi:MAG: hypothetical protein LUE12_07385 [Ruminococcus sp.]|nr:hypothetical protein [Ruminococcus sp.]
MSINELESGALITITEGTTSYDAIFVKAYEHHINFKHLTKSGNSYNTGLNLWDIQCGNAVIYFNDEKVTV